MGGKALLIVIAGFSLVYLVMGKNFGNITNRAVENAIDYYNESSAHNIAVSGANMSANMIFLDPTWRAGFDTVKYQDGVLNVRVDTAGVTKTVTAVGKFRDIIDTVTVILQPSKFSKFAYYSVVEPTGIWWVTGDTVWGPLHTQDYLRVSGSPVYWGKVTTKRDIKYNTGSNNPKFYGGFDKGVSLPLPENSVSALESQAGKKFTGHDTVYITFVSDSIKYKYAWNGATTTVHSTNFTTNGLVYASDAVLRVKGKVKGKFTLVASGSSKGTIMLDDDIVYNTDPRTAPSGDMLGLVAENFVYITDNSANNNDINIHASIFCRTDGFGAQNYSTRGIDGSIYLLGGIVQYQRQAVGQISGGSLTTGFYKRYKYDTRFMTDSPPLFPNTNSFEIVSWLE